jgi:hypothetical protein
MARKSRDIPNNLQKVTGVSNGGGARTPSFADSRALVDRGGGCHGTIARRWSGSRPSKSPRRVKMNPTWPEAIVFGQAGETQLLRLLPLRSRGRSPFPPSAIARRSANLVFTLH